MVIIKCPPQLILRSCAADNPWRCDCALHWLRTWIDEEGQRLLSSAERRLVCTEPPRLSHLSLVEVPLNSLVCIPPLVQLEPKRLAVHLGESLRVSCHATGYPRPQVAIIKVNKCNETALLQHEASSSLDAITTYKDVMDSRTDCVRKFWYLA